jgi:hypothetical protein
MTIKNWLRKIVLFPLSIIMAVPDGDGDTGDTATNDLPPLNERIMAFSGSPDAQFMPVTDKPDAAASKATDQGADPDGNPGDTDNDTEGLDTQSEEDGQDADLGEDGEDGADDSTNQETDESGEGKKGTTKKKFDERVKEVAEKIVNEKLAAKEHQAEAEKPDWVPVQQELVDQHIADTEARIDELRLEGKYTEARKLSRELDQLDADLEENEKKRVAWEARQKAKQAQTDNGDAARAELDEAAELYRAELKIEPDTWDKMGRWFESQIKTSPLLVAEFNDIYAKKGKVAAIRFAHEYTVEHMGQATKKANEQKEKSKTKAASLTASTTGKAAPLDLKKIQSEFQANPTDENFIRLQKAKREAKAA